MTEQHFPDEQMGDAVSNVLRAAAQPATAEELQGMAAFVQMFTAEVANTTTPTPIRSTMRATRITRRATAMVAITLLAAGTAAAAAGGALDSLPGPFHKDSAEVKPETTEDSVDDTDATDDTTDGITLDSPTFAPELHGLCEAWTNGATKDATDPAFTTLADAAAAAGQTIDEFCVVVQAAHESESEDEDESVEDEDESAETESAENESEGTESESESESANNEGENQHETTESEGGKGSQDSVTTVKSHGGESSGKP